VCVLGLSTLGCEATGSAEHADRSDGDSRMASAAPTSEGRVRSLPLFTVTAARDGNWLAMFMTGDEGWGDADRVLAGDLAARGMPVVALDARTYLSRRRTPDQVADDVAATLARYLGAWRRERILLLGYSRGADVMPFVANRLPDSLRARVGLVALLNVAAWAGFQFHWRDLFMTTRRATDYPVLPELERLRGTPVVCVYTADEKDSLCRRIDATLAQRYERQGVHRLRPGDVAEVERVLTRAMSSPVLASPNR
jgi:type IV secretory pathway VirJ component